MKYIIIGNGAAGTEAALTLSKITENDEILLISKSEYHHYFRPNTIEYLIEEYNSLEVKDKMTIYKQDFYEKKNIKVKLKTEIVKIDSENKIIFDKNNNQYNFDKLLLATGGYPFVPPIEGSHLNGVFTLHGFNDADKIKKFCKESNAKHLTIIGGGLLGLEIANSLNVHGHDITVIEISNRLLPKQLDEHGAKLLQELLEKRGIQFIISEQISAITSENGFADSVTLHTGKAVQTNGVIFTTGIFPLLNLAVKSGIKANRGIIINNYFETSSKDIYAAGDAIELNSERFGLWIIAKEQGKLAAENMAGLKTNYTGSTMASSLKIPGIELFSAGDLEKDKHDNFSLKKDHSYIKLISHKNNAIGVIVIGDKNAIKFARKLIQNKCTVSDFVKEFSLVKE